MEFYFYPLTQANSLVIAHTWKYPDIYSFYDMSFDKEDYEEFISVENRKKSGADFYEVKNENNQLVGFIELALKDNCCNIGLGLAPSLTGRHLGESFVLHIIEFIKQKYKNISVLTLSVVDFNQRALKVYRKVGFKRIANEYIVINDKKYRFIKMKKDLSYV